MKGRIHAETLIIFAIGIVDLVLTLLWVARDGASEGNPLYGPLLAAGVGWLVAGKLILGLLLPLLVLERGFRKSPRFTRIAARFAIAAYLLMYTVGVASLNGWC